MREIPFGFKIIVIPFLFNNYENFIILKNYDLEWPLILKSYKTAMDTIWTGMARKDGKFPEFRAYLLLAIMARIEQNLKPEFWIGKLVYSLTF